ncbi:hypothetical protein DPMN_117570 [Dreissena polymorpha]|uniref:Uncharacterized protein n=1 Tax=Dreissena polymorpha TaxID=45954 RepID=A0A9D4JEI0_DREPO|nr:hypothetical protein DPMN_134005 [Dreissena polymorpha]KAH3816063.1 hypothetical protein DPMN_117570 [Dreissena polymorpha]
MQTLIYKCTCTYKLLLLLQLKSKLPPPTATSTTPYSVDEEDSCSTSGLITDTPKSSTSKPSENFSSAISGRMDQFMDMQNRLVQHMVRPNTDRMKEAFFEYVRESVYDISPNLWVDMHRDIMKTVLVYKEKDNDLKRDQQCPPPPTTTTGPARSVCSQPLPPLWPSTVQNPVSVWGSADPAWVNQQVPYYQQSSQHNQSQRYFNPQHQQNQRLSSSRRNNIPLYRNSDNQEFSNPTLYSTPLSTILLTHRRTTASHLSIPQC